MSHSVPVKCKFLILFNRILVINVTKQMMHDGLVWHANIYVPQLKCQHLDYAWCWLLACHTRHHLYTVNQRRTKKSKTITRSVCWSVVSRRASGRQQRGRVSVSGGLACVNSGFTNLPQQQRQENSNSRWEHTTLE